MRPPSYMRSVVDRNVVMRRVPVLASGTRWHVHLLIGTNVSE